MVSLSAMVGKKVHVPMGHFDVFANLYVVFVAPPGHRKSTAMDFAGHMLEQVKVPVSLDCSTKEALVAALKTSTVAVNLPGVPAYAYTPFTILATELSEFIGPSKDGMVNFLTTIYDKRGDYTVSTVKRGQEVIEKPYLVLLGCTTPSWITARMKDDIITGGFARRCIFVYETEEGERKAFPTITDEMRAAWDRCVAHGQKLKKVAGTFQWTPEARQFFKHWYETMPVSKDPMTAGYMRNKHMQLLKVSQLIALSETTEELVLTTEHLQFGLAMLEQVDANLSKVFEGVGRNELKGLVSTLYECVRAGGGKLSEKAAMTVMFAHGTQAEITQVINYAVESGRLKRQRVQRNGAVPQTILFTPEGLEQFQREVQFHQEQPQSQTILGGLIPIPPQPPRQ